MTRDPFIGMPATHPGKHGDSPRRGVPSDVYERYVAFIDRVVNVFGSEQGARIWLDTPQPGLDGRVPLEVAEEKNFDLTYFEPLFRKAEHGIYS
jgi:uncharacterized protein (DUF2384 family)